MSELSPQSFREDLSELLLVLSGKTDKNPLDATQEFLHRNPESSEGYFVMGVLTYLSGFIGDAIKMVEKAHNLNPDVREYALALSSLYVKSDRLNDALYFAKLGTVLDSHADMAGILPPDLKNFVVAAQGHEDLHTHYVNALVAFDARNFVSAAAECRLELKMDPAYVPALDLYARTLLEMGNFGAAIPVLQNVLQLSSDHTAQYNLSLAHAINHLGLFEQAHGYIEKAVEAEPRSISLLAKAHYILSHSDDDRDMRDQIWVKLEQAGLQVEEPYFPYTPSDDGKIRIGFLSDKCYDCFEGAVLSHLLTKIDRNLIEPFVYIQNLNRDSVTQSMKNWTVSAREVFDINDKTLALILQRDQIDILIDMCGGGANQRLSLLAHQPCGLRLSWLAPPHGGGLPGIDTIVTDASTNEFDARFLQKSQECMVLRTPVFARRSAKGYGEPTPSSVSEKGYVTFGAHLDFRALCGGDGALWAKVLDRVEGSKLRLDVNGVLSELSLTRLHEVFEPLGLLDRIELYSPEEDERMGGFFDSVDIYLVSRIEKISTIVQALWMGVPCIVKSNLDGFHVSYSGAVLRAAGIPSWVCEDENSFLEKVTSLAFDPGELNGLRNVLRSQVAKSALMDVDGFALEFQGRLIELFVRKIEKGIQA